MVSSVPLALFSIWGYFIPYYIQAIHEAELTELHVRLVPIGVVETLRSIVKMGGDLCIAIVKNPWKNAAKMAVM